MNCASARCRRASSPRMTREARAGDLRRRLEIEQPERFAELDVILDREFELARLPHRRTSTLSSADAPSGTDAWVMFGSSRRKSRASSCTFSSSRSRLSCSRPRRPFAQQRLRSWPLPFAIPTCLAQCVALRLQLPRAHLDALALALERFEKRGIERHAALRNAAVTPCRSLRKTLMSSSNDSSRAFYSSSSGGACLPLLRPRERALSPMRASSPRSVG